MSALLIVLLSVAAHSPELSGGAETAATVSAKRPYELRAAIRTALRAEATASDGTAQAEAIRELCQLYHDVRTQGDMSDRSRIQWTARVRFRLLRVQRKLEVRSGRLKRLRRSSAHAAADNTAGLVSATLSGSVSSQQDCVNSSTGVTQGVLTGLAATSPGSPGGQALPPDYGLELVELIEQRISPDIWEVNGGSASIYYYRPLHAFVVRAPGGVHRQAANVLNQLRAAAP